MADMGCKVRAFDQYIETKDEKFSKHPNITFSLVGLSFVSGLIEIGKPFSRLSKIIRKYFLLTFHIENSNVQQHTVNFG
jgi:hypothetical protein